MTLEERLRALAAKGELTHVSIVAKDGAFDAIYAPASRSGYARGVNKDPVIALEEALTGTPIKVRAPKKEITAAVTPGPDAAEEQLSELSKP